MRLPFLALLVLAPRGALANGGPVAWGGEGPRGGVRSAENADVRLLSEDLLLILRPDGKGYHAQAQYLLSSAAPRTVTFGVPVSIPVADVLHESEEGSSPRRAAPADLARVARRVEIELAGKRTPCDVAAGALEDPPPPTAHREPAADDYLAKGWCVAKLAIPAGDRIPLRLEYEGELAFIDWSYTKSAFVEYGKRTLRWPLAPAGYWAGPPARVTIRLEPGPFAGLVTATPEPTLASGGVLAWTFDRADLKASPDLVATVDAAPVLRHRELVASRTETWLGKGVILAARASSTLPPQGQATYGAANAVDRDAATAWCAGKNRGAAGEWIEVRVEGDATAEHCRLEGYVLVPGYARSQRTWTGNNRLRSFRIGACGGGGEARTVQLLAPREDAGGSWEPLRLADEAERGAVLVKGFDVARECVRLTIVDVSPGERDDTCISEFRPAFNCG